MFVEIKYVFICVQQLIITAMPIFYVAYVSPIPVTHLSAYNRNFLQLKVIVLLVETFQYDVSLQQGNYCFYIFKGPMQ